MVTCFCHDLPHPASLGTYQVRDSGLHQNSHVKTTAPNDAAVNPHDA